MYVYIYTSIHTHISIYLYLSPYLYVYYSQNVSSVFIFFSHASVALQRVRTGP